MLDIFEREYGPEQYEIAVNLNNLAALKQAQGKRAEQLEADHTANDGYTRYKKKCQIETER